MRTIQHLIIAGTLMLSTGIAMAGVDNKVTSTDGFYALSQVTSVDAQVVTEFTDAQLAKVEGGHHALWHIDIPKLIPKPKLKGPCIVCGVNLVNYKDLTTIPSVRTSQVIGH